MRRAEKNQNFWSPRKITLNPWAPTAQRMQAAVAVNLSRPSGLRGLSLLRLVRERHQWNMKWKLVSTRSREISSIFIYKKKIKCLLLCTAQTWRRQKNRHPVGVAVALSVYSVCRARSEAPAGGRRFWWKQGVRESPDICLFSLTIQVHHIVSELVSL